MVEWLFQHVDATESTCLPTSAESCHDHVPVTKFETMVSIQGAIKQYSVIMLSVL